MSGRGERIVATCHALNNVFAKIMYAAELAMDQSSEAPIRRELENIVRLAGEGGALVAELNSTAGEP
ncbi:hypothetical protein [Phenylobacterium sp.]|uniref:hypothetical protein n=1 Tax=Phenylobacterium sp. TaxID=1871053 RepID=UPI002E3037EC|nr:hypothetical protein [Phenylobacterium sp.]HEX4712668.1 hypothetical protein [Phenylobacterium sp.]